MSSCLKENEFMFVFYHQNYILNATGWRDQVTGMKVEFFAEMHKADLNADKVLSPLIIYYTASFTLL